jgi:4-amino-4-deoxy-L-arabinose transferase-like glycosyltransferase
MGGEPAATRPLVVLFLVALVLRVGIASFTGLNTPPRAGSDSAEYDRYAWNMAQGLGYRGMSPDVKDQDHLTAYRTPGTSLLWAGLFKLFGHRFDVIRLAHCLLGAASCLLVFAIADKWFCRRVAWWSAAIWAVYPTSLLFSAELLSEPLGAFLFLAYLAASAAWATHPQWARALGAGAALGLCVLAHPSKIVMVPFALLWAIWQWRRQPPRMVGAIAIPLVAIAVVSPWTMRNYVVFGRFIPLSTMGGQVLLEGNNDITASDLSGYVVLDTSIPGCAAALRAPDNEIERDRVAQHLAVEWITGHPAKWSSLAQAKLRRGFTPFLQPRVAIQYRLVYAVVWGSVLLLLVIGFVPSLVSSLKQGSPSWLIHLAILHFVVLTVVFFGFARYRYPIEPLCIMIAVWTADSIWQWWRGSDSRAPSRAAVNAVGKEQDAEVPRLDPGSVP